MIDNQELQRQTAYACTIYTMVNILKYDFGVELTIDWILKIVIYMEKIGALLPRGAYFSVIYPAMAKLIEMKTGLKLKVKESTISSGLDDVSMWGLGFKKASRLYKDLARDGEMTEFEYMEIKKHLKGYGHNHAIKKGNKSNLWTLLESLGGFPYTTTLDALKYALSLDLYYDKARTFVAADEKTRNVQKRLIGLAKRRKRLSTLEEVQAITLNWGK